MGLPVLCLCCLLFSVLIYCNCLSWFVFMALIFNGLSAIVCVNRICFVLVLPY